MMSLKTILLISSVLADICSAIPVPDSNHENSLGKLANKSVATHYPGDWDNNACHFQGYRPSSGNISGMAISPSSWYNGGYCGSCMNVGGPKGNSIKTMIVDRCADCTVDVKLFDDAYYQLASKAEERINVELGTVSCDFSAPLAVQNREGTSAYWFSMQVQNSNWPVYDMDVSIDGGKTWTLAVSRDYNFFEHPTSQPFGALEVDLRITCSTGKIVEMKNVSVVGNSKHYATTNC